MFERRKFPSDVSKTPSELEAIMYRKEFMGIGTRSLAAAAVFPPMITE
jgi:hypothetical protein